MPEADLTLLRAVAREAGRIARRHFRNSPAVRDKGNGQGPVSAADLEVNAMLERELRRARPAYGWLSEETEDDPARLDADRVFIVDPIDGTRAFIDGDPHFAHALAVADRGRVVAAVVYLPEKDQLFEAALGSGARLNGVPVAVSARDPSGDLAILATRSTLAEAAWTGGTAGLTRHFRPSLANRLCLVGQGRFDAMVTLRDAWEWDIAAGALIVAEAGGIVSDRSGAALRFNNAHPVNEGVVAGFPLAHADLMARLGASRTGAEKSVAPGAPMV